MKSAYEAALMRHGSRRSSGLKRSLQLCQRAREPRIPRKNAALRQIDRP
jgi:hypothetical protein